MKETQMRTVEFRSMARLTFVVLISLTTLATLPQGAFADDKPVVPKFAVAKSAQGLAKQVKDYDAHLEAAKTASEAATDIAFSKHDVEQDAKSESLAGHEAKAKAGLAKYEALGAKENDLNTKMVKEMAQALGLYRAIKANSLYAGHYKKTTTALNPMALNEYVTDMGAGDLKFIKAR